MDKYYYTRYRPKMCVARIGDKPGYGNGVWAESYEDAERLIELRQIPGEFLENAQPVGSSFDPPTHEHVAAALLHKTSRKKFNAGLHALTFLSFMATCAGKATSEEILGDGGVLHEFVHEMTDTSDIRLPFEHLMISVIDLELSIPGYLSKAQREHASRYKNTLQERITREA